MKGGGLYESRMDLSRQPQRWRQHKIGLIQAGIADSEMYATGRFKRTSPFHLPPPPQTAAPRMMSPRG